MNLQPEILENDIVKIIPLKERDFESLFKVAADPLIWEQHPTKDRFKREVFQLFFDGAIASGSAFLVFDKTSNELIGSTRFYDYKPELSSVAIGFTFLAKKFWGGSYNKATKTLLLDYAFQFVDVVLFHIGATNIRSQKAILKIGAKKVNEVYLDNYDHKLLHYEYEIKKEEWHKLSSTSSIRNQDMNFTVEKSIEILERTPGVLLAMLQDLSDFWTSNNEGKDTWSAFDIVGHLIEGEKTDWIPRMEIILSDKPDKTFTPFDRFAQYEDSKGKTLAQLLEEFKTLRTNNIAVLRSKKLTTLNNDEKGIHPAFGEVTLSQLLSTWTVHDLNHIAQIARVMAKQYKPDVGPWTAYLKILQ